VERELGDMCHINYGYTESSSFEEIGPKFLRITDIKDNKVDWASVPYCPIEICNYPKYELQEGDIVFARTGATTGKSYLVVDPPESVFASYLIRMRMNVGILDPKFVNMFFQTSSYWENIRSGVSGSAQGGFNAKKLSELIIPFPKSLRLQLSTVETLERIQTETQRLASIYERKIAALDELKRSLLQQAFEGNL
jgi:type I restriction enzyme S subunit